MSTQYPNPISETRYRTDTYFYITQILLLFTNASLLNLIPDISMISFLYHERISLYVYQNYVNAISKSYIRNLILRRYTCASWVNIFKSRSFLLRTCSPFCPPKMSCQKRELDLY